MTRKISLAVAEGALDSAAADRLLDVLEVKEQGFVVIDKRGGTSFWPEVHRYNDAAEFCGPILGLVDLEGGPCPSALIAKHLPHGRNPDFVLRIAERMLESWLLADRRRIAEYLRVPVTRIPATPDELDHAKLELVNIARRSRSREIREDMVPEPGTSGIIGKGYTTHVQTFIRERWNPLDAQHASGSLQRAIRAIQARCLE